MNRYGYLWDQVTSFENLLTAARQAQKGKRFRDNVLTPNIFGRRDRSFKRLVQCLAIIGCTATALSIFMKYTRKCSIHC